jgi:hypothetical protein
VAQSLSTVSWWNDHQVWWDGRTPVEMERAGEPRLAVCARNWVRELEALQAGLAGVEAGRVLTLRFEELLRDPVRQVEKLVEFLGLDCPAEFRRAVASLGLRPGASGRERLTGTQRELVLREAQPLLQKLGYLQ